MARYALAVALLFAAMTAPAHAAVPDPSVSGAAGVERLDYSDGNELVGGPGALYPQEIKGSLHIPMGVTGPRPVIVFLHGRHSTCTALSIETLGSPCPTTPLTASIDSYKGYDYIAEKLASQGYLVMSVDANGINTYDTANLDSGANARSQVLARSLDRLGTWNKAAGPGAVGTKLVGKVDLSRIGMMGHSRGGEGVTDFIAYNKTRTDGPQYPGLKAVFALAPIDSKAQRPTGVAWATGLPYCDGDVTPLNGSRPFERSKYDETDAGKPRIQFGVNGANHNYFNTIWTNDDNGGSDDAACGSAAGNNRLSPANERRVGLMLIAGFLRRYVGPEPAFDPLMTGAEPVAGSGCPGGTGACDGLVQTSYVGGAEARHVLLEPGAANTLTAAADGGAVTATGLTEFATCTPGTDGTGCPSSPNRSLARQLTVGWNTPSTLRVALQGASADASRYGALTLRAAPNFADVRNTPGASQDFTVTLEDAAGRRAGVNAADYDAGALVPSAGSTEREVVLGGIRIPLTAFPGIDPARLSTLELGFGTRTSAGSIQLADVLLQEPVSTPSTPDGSSPGVAGGAAGGGAAGGGTVGGSSSRPAACADAVRPLGRIASRKGIALRRRSLVLRGSARDSGCVRGGSRVRRVRVATFVRTSARRCRYLSASGRLGRSRSCSRPVFVTAKGTASWRLVFRARPPAGRYRVLVRAQDRAGNVQRPSARRSLRVRSAER